MKMMTKLALGVALLIPVGGFAAYAAGDIAPPPPQMEGPMHGPSGGPMFGKFLETFDLKHDGHVTRDEILKVVTDKFNAADAKHDGQVTLEEFIPFWVNEHRNEIVRAFQHFDISGDGKITLDEVNKIAERFADRLEYAPDHDGQGPGPEGDHRQPGPRGPMMGGHLKEVFDLNKDGKITKDEILKVAADKFATADTKHDGQVTLDGFTTFFTFEMHERIVREFQFLDVNGDGKITLEEAHKAGERLAFMVEHAPRGPQHDWQGAPRDGDDHGKRGPHVHHGQHGPDGHDGPDDMTPPAAPKP